MDNQVDPIGEEIMDSISSMLTKEIKGKLVISKSLDQTSRYEHKDSLKNPL